jgi:pleiotropic regulator 1
MAAQVADGPDVSRLEALVRDNARRTKSIFASTTPDSSARKRIKLDPGLASEDPDITKSALSLRIHAEYSDVQTLPEVIAKKLPAAGPRKKKPKAGEEAPSKSEEHARKLIEGIPAGRAAAGGANSSALVLSRNKPTGTGTSTAAGGKTQNRNEPQNMSLSRRPDSMLAQPRPDWHAPWKLQRVISGHLGWVRALAVEPNNQWFASGAGDRTIKIWDIASGQLKLTLTGHISTVRGLAVSSRHPYMFSCGEDKMVKCWDLETNKVVSRICPGIWQWHEMLTTTTDPPLPRPSLRRVRAQAPPDTRRARHGRPRRRRPRLGHAHPQQRTRAVGPHGHRCGPCLPGG